MIRLLLALSLLILLPPVLFAQAGPSAIRVIDSRLKKMAEEEYLSGVVLIARDGKVLLNRAYGFANRADQVPNRPDTRFNMASMTKMFTGMAILQLAEKGKLSLEGKVGRYLPDYPNRPVADSVTLHQLLTHTSGLGNFWTELDMVPKDKYRSVDDYVRLFVSHPLLFKPGSRYQYSNSGYVLLGKIIETVSGQTYFDYVHDHILLPAGMNDTGPLQLDDATPRMATGYTMSVEQPGHWKNNLYENVFKGGPAGGYYTTAADLLRFSGAVIAGRLLGKEYTALYVTGKVGYDRGNYAYGMSIDTIGGHAVFGHTGGHFGIANELLVCPEPGYTVVIMTNGEVENYWQVSHLVKSLLLGSSVASDNYYFTMRVIDSALQRGEAAGEKAAAAGKYKLRESVIDRWAWHSLFNKKNREAVALFSLNVKSFPQSSGALYGLAEGYRLTGDTQKAITAYEQYLTMEPDDAAVKEKLGLLKKGKPAEYRALN